MLPKIKSLTFYSSKYYTLEDKQEERYEINPINEQVFVPPVPHLTLTNAAPVESLYLGSTSKLTHMHIN